jgi:hypothetical protein
VAEAAGCFASAQSRCGKGVLDLVHATNSSGSRCIFEPGLTRKRIEADAEVQVARGNSRQGPLRARGRGQIRQPISLCSDREFSANPSRCSVAGLSDPAEEGADGRGDDQGGAPTPAVFAGRRMEDQRRSVSLPLSSMNPVQRHDGDEDKARKQSGQAMGQPPGLPLTAGGARPR